MNDTTYLKPLVYSNGDSKQKSDDIIISHSDAVKGVLNLPSMMPSFLQSGMPRISSVRRNYGNGKAAKYKDICVYLFEGDYIDEDNGKDLYCPLCRSRLYDNGTSTITLNHLPFGKDCTKLEVKQRRIRCFNEKCHYSYTYHPDFKAQSHNITCALETFVKDLLCYGLNLTSVSLFTGLSRQVVKKIDLERLKEKYTVDGTSLKKPESYSKYLAVDEFKLHDGHKYATVIADLETGHILWLAHGKKKSSIYGFIDHAGKDFMDHVKAVACDMNSDFEEAFKERYPHIVIIYDRFHILKNFNDKVISEVRKDEQARLKEEGNDKAAKDLKHSKYILMASRKTRDKHDSDVLNNKLVSKESILFNKPELRAKGNMNEKYQQLINSNRLLFTIDLVKEQLNDMFSCIFEKDARDKLEEIIDTCKGTDNRHFAWFASLLENHKDGIVAYSRYHISTSKLEGINNMIKTERRIGYGYPDDEYFFLRIIDRSHRNDQYS